MNYMNWVILSDNYDQVKKEWDQRGKWVLVDCKVLSLNGEIHQWSLMYDEYMLKKTHDDIIKNHATMTDDEIGEALKQYQYWKGQITDRIHAEKEAGEDL